MQSAPAAPPKSAAKIFQQDIIKSVLWETRESKAIKTKSAEPKERTQQRLQKNDKTLEVL